jgi:DNA-binding PadR family transcriptional regulator
MSEDMPWVIGLTDEEVQELRKNKQELTEYGREKIRKLMNKEPTHEEMIEEAARRELANKEFKDLTDQERIKLALEELDWIVIGGQDGEEFYNSIQFIRRVLKSFR